MTAAAYRQPGVDSPPHSPWLLDPVTPTPRDVRLFCLPYAGGGASAYVPWRLAQVTLDVQPVKLPGRESRAAEPPARDLEQLAAQIAAGILPHATGRFALFGHSMGALLALETARLLEAAGAGPERLFVSGRLGPDGGNLPDVAGMSDADVVAYLKGVGGTPNAIIDDPEIMALFMPTIRADLTICATYRHRPDPRLTCPISVLYGLSDGPGEPGAYDRWRRLSGRTTMHGFQGRHFFPFQESRTEVLECVIRQLR